MVRSPTTAVGKPLPTSGAGRFGKDRERVRLPDHGLQTLIDGSRPGARPGRPRARRMRQLDADAYLAAARTCDELLESLASYAQRDESTTRLEDEIRIARLEALRAAERASHAPA
jgi:hypothetical protein